MRFENTYGSAQLIEILIVVLLENINSLSQYVKALVLMSEPFAKDGKASFRIENPDFQTGVESIFHSKNSTSIIGALLRKVSLVYLSHLPPPE